MKLKSKKRIWGMAVILLAVVLSQPASALAWGREGHVIVAHLASRMLTPRAATAVDDLLRGDETLENIALWADGVRGSGSNPGPRVETPRWHFVSIPRNEINFDAARHCPETANGSCVVSALVFFQDVLAKKKRGYYNDEFNRYEALKFIVHFTGDIHQPLHCIEDNDTGGNGKKVYWLKKAEKRNLHSVWDNEILEADMKARNFTDPIAYADFLFDSLTPEQIKLADPNSATKLVARAQIEAWANESHALARNAYNDLGPRDNDGFYFLKDAYRDKYKPEVNKRLATAGIRLARILNENLR